MYYVQIISFDLRHEETIIQALNALDYLQAAIDNAFDKIDKRIANNKQKIECIESRINIASNKVGKIFMANKAVKLFAPAKFPATNVLVDISSTFGVLPINFSELLLDYDVEDTPQSNTAFQNKLEFFHVKNQHKKIVFSKVLLQKQVCSIPNYLKFVNTVLLFNIFQKDYNFKHSTVRNFPSVNYSNNKPDVGLEIVAAPTSITNRQISDNFNMELLYIPKLNGAPHINLPLDLPDLPGIADDVQFESKEESKIAPSSYIEQYIPPKLVCDVPKAPPAPPLIVEPNIKSDLPKNVDRIIQHSPPPSPHLPPSSSHLPQSFSHLPQSSPHPPPPSPPILRKITTKANISESTDARSNLMDAIRKAGGTMGGKLRASFDSQKKVSVKNDKDTASTLLDDLHNKLVMRRKGISGTKPKSENVIQRLSELMPPPPPPQKDLSSDTTDDDDWN